MDVVMNRIREVANKEFENFWEENRHLRVDFQIVYGEYLNDFKGIKTNPHIYTVKKIAKFYVDDDVKDDMWRLGIMWEYRYRGIVYGEVVKNGARE